MQQLKLINAAETIAILIGASEFEDKSFINAPPIKNNVNKLLELLQDDSILGLAEDRILVFDQNESHNIILRKIRAFVKSKFADTVIFYFAGHGYKTDKGDFYLVTANADKEDIDITSIPWNKIKNILEKGEGIQQRIYILDACHSGAAALGEHDDETQIAAGSALIAAAKADAKAYFNTTDEYTHFTNALISLLEKGINKTDMAALDTNTLFDQLQAALSDAKFEVTKKTTHEIDKVSFFKNKGFDQLGGKRKEIESLIKEGDGFFKNLKFRDARRAYLEASHEAKKSDKFQKLTQQIKTKIEKNDAVKKYKKVFEDYFTQELKEKENKLVELKSKLNKTHEELKIIEQKIVAQQKQLIANHTSIAQFKKLNTKLHSIKKQLEKELTEKNKALTNALAEIKQQKKQIAQLEKSAKESSTSYNKLFKENEIIKKELNTLKIPPKAVIINDNFTQEIGNTSFDMVFIKGGTFEMGNDDYGATLHQVKLNNFYMGEYTVTQKLWKEIMGDNPSYFKGCDDCPVEQVSWDDIQIFIEKLNKKTSKNYRLPTEAEWEYAAGGGSAHQKWAGTEQENKLGDYAWYKKNKNSKTHPVGTKKPNLFGLYDMSGNVWEWCSDWYGQNYYQECKAKGLVVNPKGADNGVNRVYRGGSWNNDAEYCRVSFRYFWYPSNRNINLGFRLVHSSKKASTGK